MSDLVDKLRAEIAEDVEITNGEDSQEHAERFWPDRIDRQAEAFLEILELHTPRTHEVRAFVEEARRKESAVPYEPTGAIAYSACGGRDWDLERFDTWEHCATLLALFKVYDIKPTPPPATEVMGHATTSAIVMSSYLTRTFFGIEVDL